jgi:hypothetical protein
METLNRFFQKRLQQIYLAKDKAAHTMPFPNQQQSHKSAEFPLKVLRMNVQ